MKIGLLILIAAAIAAAADDALTAKYCAGCHDARVKAGGLNLAGVASDEAAAQPEVWEKVVKRLRAGEMPPPGAPRPDAATATALAGRLVQQLDAQKPYAGRAVIRRLNRTEYANAIRDLLDLELPLAAELPADQAAGGFDNIADALSLSPLLLENYLRVARKVSELATGTGDATPVTEIYRAQGTQAAWLGEGMPFGTRGGIRVQHWFPRDGDYDLRAFLVKESLTPLEGVRFFRTRLTGVRAGSHSVVVTFPDEFAEREGPVMNVGGVGGAALGGPLDALGTAIRPTLDFRLDGRRVKLFEIGGMTAGEAAFDGQPGPPALARIEITGPHNVVSAGDTPSRRRIFTCRESTPACAEKILNPIARRAFRRDLAPAEIEPFLKTYAGARQKVGFEAAIAAAVRDILLAPDFLFRLEFDAPQGAPGTAQPVSDFELASRLSFFLWSSLPDDELLDTAARGGLRTPADVEREARRMLASRKATSLIDNFVTQWLGLNTLDSVEPDRQLFPAYDRGLSAAFAQETRLFVGSLLRENRPLADLINAGYTYLNDRLAAHYGIPGVVGPGFRRVTMNAGSGRGGLLTQGSVLMLTSHPTRTSPVLRGKWLLDNLLNSPPPAPPATVPPLDESPRDGRKLTAREQVERHRNNPSCAACHNRIDPLGFALENYDVLGRHRTHDEGSPINVRTKLGTGFEIDGATGLAAMLTARQEELALATAERLMTYALGRELDARDQPAIRRIVRESAAGGYRFQDLIVAVTQSVPFRMRQKQEP